MRACPGDLPESGDAHPYDAVAGQGVAAIQLGIGRNDQFFCSQLVLEAYRSAGLPLTDADPRLVSPADLLHMREDDVPSIRIHQPLQYVGHLKFQPAAPEASVAATP